MNRICLCLSMSMLCFVYSAETVVQDKNETVVSVTIDQSKETGVKLPISIIVSGRFNNSYDNPEFNHIKANASGTLVENKGVKYVWKNDSWIDNVNAEKHGDTEVKLNDDGSKTVSAKVFVTYRFNQVTSGLFSKQKIVTENKHIDTVLTTTVKK